MPSSEVVLSGEPQDAGLARRFVTDALTAWGAGPHAYTAALLVSEMVANAALHAHTQITVHVQLTGDTLRLSVTDGSPRQPVVRHYGAEATTGRGLGLVIALAQRWGVEPAGAGKTVWVELDASRAQPTGVSSAASAGDNGGMA